MTGEPSKPSICAPMRSFALGDMGPMIRVQPRLRAKSKAASNSIARHFLVIDALEPAPVAGLLPVRLFPDRVMDARDPPDHRPVPARKEKLARRVLPEGVLLLVELRVIVHEELGDPVGIVLVQGVGNFTNSFICFFETTCSTVTGMRIPPCRIVRCDDCRGSRRAVKIRRVTAGRRSHEHSDECGKMHRIVGPSKDNPPRGA